MIIVMLAIMPKNVNRDCDRTPNWLFFLGAHLGAER